MCQLKIIEKKQNDQKEKNITAVATRIEAAATLIMTIDMIILATNPLRKV